MEKFFYIFRHGETEWNRLRRCQGHTNIPLNKTGREQAQLLAEKLHDHAIEVVYSSDLSRALETARAFTEMRNLPLIQRPELRESNLGELEGLNRDEAKAKFGEEMWYSFRSLGRENLEARFPGGESRQDVLDRLHGFVHEMLNQSDYRHIGVSTHGGALRNLLHSFLPDDSEALPIPNCALYRLIYSPGSEKEWEVKGPF